MKTSLLSTPKGRALPVLAPPRGRKKTWGGPAFS
jgi:hypothetical protein